MSRAKDAVIDLFAAALLRTFDEMMSSDRESMKTRDQVAPGALAPLTMRDSQYRWIRLAKHCETTGDTPNAVHARRRKRIWTDGVQCRLGPDGNLYISPEGYNRWVEGG